ncbi:MAG TPA: flagellin [Bryobacteraceae bacterium]|nr:flagellin [Bryobacteraceae bacterium]
MPFSIQTNVNSLIAQENLYTNSQFQSKTIDELTSGYRINQSGDDAAGLAIANGYRDEEAQLTQGVSNANDGVAQLQIMDGGMSNIGTMLDRLQTLATESATQGFTGNRTVLNDEYQGLVSEIDRQAQSIGLSTGGHFAQNLNIYVGGGESVSGASSTQNGMVALDLSNSAVDSKALGLRTSEFTAGSATGTNLAEASNTSVANIATANAVSGTTTATFELSGAGFSNMAVSVNLSTSDTTQTVAQKLNTAIEAMGNDGTAAGDALRTANIQVAATTDSSGNQGLSFTSATGAFQVTAGSNAANALLGSFSTVPGGNAATGASVSQAVTGTTTSLPTTAGTVNFNVLVNGTAVNLSVATTGTEASINDMLTDITSSAQYSQLTALGVTAQVNPNNTNELEFVGNSNQSVEVEAAGDTANNFGFGSWSAASNTQTAAGAANDVDGQSATVQFSINGGQAINVNFDSGPTLADTEANLQAAINANSELNAAGLYVSDNGTNITINSGGSAAPADAPTFRMNVLSQTGGLDLGFGTGVSSTATLTATDQAAQLSAQGSSETGLGTNNDVFSFAGLTNSGYAGGTSGADADQQVLSFSADDANGNLQSTSVTLNSTNAGDVDQAITAINNALQTSGNATMEQIVAVKETNAAGTAEGIRFISSLSNFNVNVGTAVNNSSADPVGLYDGTAGATTTQGQTVASSSSGAINISTVAGALQAVTAVGNAVQQLGVAQAAVGRGENQLNYAIDLANSQNTNYASAESDIRDADVATEAANLTKAQVLQQAAIAAMAQANSAPQAILSLLRG